MDCLLRITIHRETDKTNGLSCGYQSRRVGKFVLRVDGKPFYMTNVQLRTDKLRGYEGWTEEAIEKAVKQVADDHFNTLSIPVFGEK